MKPIELLLVEDNPNDIHFTQYVLKKTRICNTLHVVQDGVDAISFLKKEDEYKDAVRPDIIFLDINLPKKNGMEVLSEIKNNPQLMTIPVVILTSSESERDIHKAHGLRADWYITKPIDFPQLLSLFKAFGNYGLAIVKLARNEKTSAIKLLSEE